MTANPDACLIPVVQEINERMINSAKVTGSSLGTGGMVTNLTAALLDRLRPDVSSIEGMATGLREVALLDDTVGEALSMKTRPNGLQIAQVQVGAHTQERRRPDQDRG